jgi:hypothetical protein
MNLDWIVAIFIFLFFTAWSFSYYFMLFPTKNPMNLESAAETVEGRIIDYLSVDCKEIPVRFNSSGAVADVVLYFNYTWPYNKNATKVVTDKTSMSSLDCRYVGDTLYWKTDLSDGFNYFWIVMLDIADTPLNCNGTFNVSDAIQTIPWVEEADTMLVMDRINEMTNTSYNQFKSTLSINRNFRIEMNISGTVIEYGSNKPKISDIYLREKSENVYTDTGVKKADIKIFVW